MLKSATRTGLGQNSEGSAPDGKQWKELWIKEFCQSVVGLCGEATEARVKTCLAAHESFGESCAECLDDEEVSTCEQLTEECREPCAPATAKPGWQTRSRPEFCQSVVGLCGEATEARVNSCIDSYASFGAECAACLDDGDVSTCEQLAEQCGKPCWPATPEG